MRSSLVFVVISVGLVWSFSRSPLSLHTGRMKRNLPACANNRKPCGYRVAVKYNGSDSSETQTRFRWVNYTLCDCRPNFNVECPFHHFAKTSNVTSIIYVYETLRQPGLTYSYQSLVFCQSPGVWEDCHRSPQLSLTMSGTSISTISNINVHCLCKTHDRKPEASILYQFQTKPAGQRRNFNFTCQSYLAPCNRGYVTCMAKTRVNNAYWTTYYCLCPKGLCLERTYSRNRTDSMCCTNSTHCPSFIH